MEGAGGSASAPVGADRGGTDDFEGLLSQLGGCFRAGDVVLDILSAVGAQDTRDIVEFVSALPEDLGMNSFNDSLSDFYQQAPRAYSSAVYKQLMAHAGRMARCARGAVKTVRSLKTNTVAFLNVLVSVQTKLQELVDGFADALLEEFEEGAQAGPAGLPDADPATKHARLMSRTGMSKRTIEGLLHTAQQWLNGTQFSFHPPNSERTLRIKAVLVRLGYNVERTGARRTWLHMATKAHRSKLPPPPAPDVPALAQFLFVTAADVAATGPAQLNGLPPMHDPGYLDALDVHFAKLFMRTRCTQRKLPPEIWGAMSRAYSALPSQVTGEELTAAKESVAAECGYSANDQTRFIRQIRRHLHTKSFCPKHTPANDVAITLAYFDGAVETQRRTRQEAVQVASIHEGLEAARNRQVELYWRWRGQQSAAAPPVDGIFVPPVAAGSLVGHPFNDIVASLGVATVEVLCFVYAMVPPLSAFDIQHATGVRLDAIHALERSVLTYLYSVCADNDRACMNTQLGLLLRRSLG